MKIRTFKTVMVALLTAIAVSCATTTPARLDVRDVVTNPQSHTNQRIEVTGYILDYQPPAGDTYRTWDFALGFTPAEKLAVSVAGYTAASISKAAKLAEEARNNQEPVTLIGKLKVTSKAGSSAGAEVSVPQSELKLESIEYRGQKISVNEGPRSQPGFSVGGWYFNPSIGIGATITP